MLSTFKLFLLLRLLSSSAAQDPLVCGSIQSGVCYVEEDHVWQADAEIKAMPSTLRVMGDNERPVAPNETVHTLVVTSGRTLECKASLCELELSGFRTISIQGSATVMGSKIVMFADGGIIIALNAKISTTGRGYPAGEGDGAGRGYVIVCPGNYCDSSTAAASHGGYGGQYNRGGCDYAPEIAQIGLYGSDTQADTFGSGGWRRRGGSGADVSGGGIIDLNAGSIISIAGSIDSNAHALCERCDGGSGGSVRITANSIAGGGYIQANGGSGDTGGGGGRILLTADSLNLDNLLVEAEGGGVQPGIELCAGRELGEDGTVVTRCRTSTCNHEGKIRDDGKCGCVCEEPWAGTDCSVCTLSCANGGTVDQTMCTCDCPSEWTGDRCLRCNSKVLCNDNGQCSFDSSSRNFTCSCDDSWFGISCETFCDRTISCTSNGVCSDDGQKCVCFPGKVGKDCLCDQVDCNAEDACSGNGQCRDGECYCGPGWSGCNCQVYCSNQETCSGHGTCQSDGECSCDPGYTGKACAQDPFVYCNSGETMSSYPCLPGIADVLGYGFDALSGRVLATRIVPMQYSQGKTWTVGGKTWEVPDGVVCRQSASNIGQDTRVFTSTQDFRYYLGTRFGLTGNFKRAYLSSSSEYEQVLDKSFLHNRALFVSHLDHGMYECSLVDSIDLAVSSEAQSAVEKFEKGRLVRALGTHYVTFAVVGGQLTVFNFVEKCVFQSLSMEQVKNEVEATFVTLIATESDTEVSTTSSCSVLWMNSKFSKTIIGGDRTSLIIPGASSLEDLRHWLDSLITVSDVIKLEVIPTSNFFPNLSADIEEYVESPTIVEYEFDDIGFVDGDTCTAECDETSYGATVTTWKAPALVGLLFFIVFDMTPCMFL